MNNRTLWEHLWCLTCSTLCPFVDFLTFTGAGIDIQFSLVKTKFALTVCGEKRYVHDGNDG